MKQNTWTRSFNRIIYWIWLPLLFSACTTGPAPETEVKIDPTLPIPKEIKTIGDLDSVAFEWQVADDPRVNGYVFYRNDPENPSRLIQLDSKVLSRYSNHFVDEDLKPGTTYYYKLATFDQAGRESDKSELLKVTTQKLEPVSYVQAISNYPEKIKIIWRPHPDPQVSGYIIERENPAENRWDEIGKTNNRLQVEYLDEGLKHGFTYRYRIKAKTYGGLESQPSEISQGKTKLLPTAVSEIKATTNLPKRIEITWHSSGNEDIAHYNIYRNSQKEGRYDYVAKLNRMRYVDAIDDNGAIYYYKITATDKDGLESPLPDVPAVGKTLPPPATPLLTTAGIKDGKITLSWEPTDKRTTSYIVHKESGLLINQKVTNYNIRKGKVFVDPDVLPGERYKYSLSGVDEFGIVSKPSDQVELLLPKPVQQ